MDLEIGLAAMVEPWMDRGLCGNLDNLPWIAAPDRATGEELARMQATCRICGVSSSCARFVLREHITSGFWAGKYRDEDYADQSMGGAA